MIMKNIVEKNVGCFVTFSYSIPLFIIDNWFQAVLQWVKFHEVAMPYLFNHSHIHTNNPASICVTY